MGLRLKNEQKKPISLIAHSHPKSTVAEQYRQLRTNIHFSLGDTRIKTIVVTSPEPSDGKSTTAANLAIVLAQQEKPVLLVDADLRKPSLHYAFNSNNSHGLTSLLTKKSNLDQAIAKTHVPNLYVLTCGPIPPNPSELLDSETMETMIEELKGLYEYVIFDTSPILAVTDPQIVANKCDGVVMVVTTGKTSKDAAEKAKALLEKARSQLLGVVVNEVEFKKKGYKEYHYYYR